MTVKRFGSSVSDAQRCQATSTCEGAAVLKHTCFSHLGPQERERAFADAIAGEPEDRVIDLRGAIVDSDLARRLELALFRAGEIAELLMSNATVRHALDLSNAEVGLWAADGVEFQSDVRLRDLTVRSAFFMGSWFRAVVRVGAVQFKADATFNDATFDGPAFFGEPAIKPELDFSKELSFSGATFAAHAIFEGVRGHGPLDLRGVTIRGPAVFANVHVAGSISASNAAFCRGLNVKTTHVDGSFDLASAKIRGHCVWDLSRFHSMTLRRARLEEVTELGPFAVRDALVLDEATFEGPVRVQCAGGVTHIHRTVFDKGTSLNLVGEVVLEGAVLPSPTELTRGSTRWRSGKDTDRDGAMRLLSLRGSDVDGLAISQADLSSCLFSGAHRLDSVRLGPGVAFGAPPRFRWQRDVIAEEHIWRHRGDDRSKSWKAPRELLPEWLINGFPPTGIASSHAVAVGGPDTLAASDVAETYRALRKAREDAKDHPGAADFYYGEMEMRRHRGAELKGTLARNLTDRAVLHTYWALSGYGLRAWRPLIALAVLVALSACALDAVGYRGDAHSAGDSLRFAISAATSLIRPVEDDALNGFGFALEILLRFAGPALLALSVLAVRARIKR